MTELSFLIELLLNHDLPKATRDLLASRIKEVEQGLTTNQGWQPVVAKTRAQLPDQAPSTLAAMARHGGLVYDTTPPEMPPVEVAQIAQTPAAAAALSQRQQMISASINRNNLDPNTGTPKKFRGALKPPP